MNTSKKEQLGAYVENIVYKISTHEFYMLNDELIHKNIINWLLNK